MIIMEFSKSLATLRKEANLSQDDLAEQLHITRQAVSKWESGLSTPDIDTVVKLCNILNTSPNKLLTDCDDGLHTTHGSKKHFTNIGFVMICIFCFLILVCGTGLLIINLFNGFLFEEPIHYLALGLIACSIILFFIAVAIDYHRRKKQ